MIKKYGLKKLIVAGLICATLFACSLQVCATEKTDISSVLNEAGKAGNDIGAETIKSPRIGYIYTGDSRIRRLNVTINMKGMKDNWVVCKSGMGYNWFVSYGLPEIDRLMKEKTYIDKWVIISGWGVNDLWNSEVYIDRYTRLMDTKWKDCDLYLMSVNPVNGSKTAKYRTISSFNARIKEYIDKSEKNISYIDTNSIMVSKGFSTIDGLHYSENTNRLIYKTIRDRLDEEYATINYEKITMNINSMRTIKLNNYGGKVRWKCNNRNIARIVETLGPNKNIVTIQAMAPGQSTLTAYYGGKKSECVINIVDERIMIAYFSYSGEVEQVAEYLQKRVGGQLVWIDRSDVYPYTDGRLLKVMERELRNNERPQLDTVVEDMSAYDTIYLGFPSWLEYAPRPVCTFLETYEMTGKLIKPFIIKGDLLENKDKSIPELKEIVPKAVFEQPLIIDKERVLSKRLRKEIRKYFEE